MKIPRTLGSRSFIRRNFLFFSVYRSKIWSASSINDAAMALYGREKFSTLQKSEEIEIIVPKGSILDRDNIIIGVSSRIKSNTVAIFQDANPQSLVAVFYVHEGSIVAYELTIRMEFKGTLFAVVEDLNGNLYYTRAYVDVLTMSCMAW
ncbi:MAG: thiosulfate oxidation carrier protein SoxY [Campylobacterota bacterium]|nr:thiosulfate oxidation carrier protein SoxY [Campylobacterota bacterium]